MTTHTPVPARTIPAALAAFPPANTLAYGPRYLPAVAHHRDGRFYRRGLDISAPRN